MRKIISLFQRNYETDRLVRDEVVPGAEWVLAGEGIATRKLDGSCTMLRDRKLFKRHELKQGRTAPANFEPAQEPDAVTGEVTGWVPVGDSPEDKWFREALSNACPPESDLEDGTYEAIGPHFQGNPEHHAIDILVRHGDQRLPDAPRTFAELKAYLLSSPYEGIVWHHPDGRMVKIKARDFEKKARKSV